VSGTAKTVALARRRRGLIAVRRPPDVRQRFIIMEIARCASPLLSTEMAKLRRQEDAQPDGLFLVVEAARSEHAGPIANWARAASHGHDSPPHPSRHPWPAGLRSRCRRPHRPGDRLPQGARRPSYLTIIMRYHAPAASPVDGALHQGAQPHPLPLERSMLQSERRLSAERATGISFRSSCQVARPLAHAPTP
jgi:hypothetical protein